MRAFETDQLLNPDSGFRDCANRTKWKSDATTIESLRHYRRSVRRTGITCQAGTGMSDRAQMWNFTTLFLDDLDAAADPAMAEVPWVAGAEDAASLNAHTAFLSGWMTELGKRATEILRPKYGQFYGFEYTTPKNAEIVALTFFSYR